MEHSPLRIGGLIFPGMDQMDFTGPFEVLSLIPNSTFHTLEGPVPRAGWPRAGTDSGYGVGGAGAGRHRQEALMEDDEVLGFLRTRARSACPLLSGLYWRTALRRGRTVARR